MRISVDHFSIVKSLADHIGLNLSGLNYYRRYSDPVENPHFNDYILSIGNKFFTICEVFECSRARYEVLIKLQEYMRPHTDIFECQDAFIFECDGRTWYFESMNMYSNNYVTSEKMSVDGFQQLLTSVQTLNSVAGDFTKTLAGYADHNKFFVNYVNRGTERINSYFDIDIVNQFNARMEQDEPFLNFTDIEKTFELSRITPHNTGYRVTGLQGFCGAPAAYGYATTVLFTTFHDTDDEIFKKVDLLEFNNAPSIVKNLAQDRISLYTAHPKFCYIDTTKTIPHFKRLIDLL